MASQYTKTDLLSPKQLNMTGTEGAALILFSYSSADFQKCLPPFFFSLNKILERVYAVKKKDRNENDQILWRNWRDNVGHSGHSRYKVIRTG